MQSSIAEGAVPAGMLFLPQIPYNFLGSLRQQIQYPSVGSKGESPSSTDDDDERMLSLLDKVELGGLAARVGGLGVQLDWSNTLSLGEQQRLALPGCCSTSPVPWC